MSIQVDDFVIDLAYRFKRSVKRKATSRDYMAFTNTEVKKIIKHVTTRWLSLGRSLDRTLLQWDTLQPYFLSEFDDNNEAKDDNRVNREVCLIRKFSDPFTKGYFVCAISNTSF